MNKDCWITLWAGIAFLELGVICYLLILLGVALS